MNIQFSGKTALVTGAAHGFGRAIAQALAARGAKVWICDLLPEELAETVQACREAGGDCTARTVNVTDRDAVGALVAEAGPIDILVNNAGGVLGQVGDRSKRSHRSSGRRSLMSTSQPRSIVRRQWRPA